MNVLSQLISAFDPDKPNFRPTELYNESWLIKLVLHQASSIDDSDFVLGFLPKSTWFSEGLLPTTFKARYRGDPQSESRTNADGVIGHIQIGRRAKADLELDRGANQFTVIEARIGAPLSPGTINAKYFDQAARSVACMTEVMARASVEPSSLSRLEFVVIAPQYSIEKGTFSKEMEADSILSKVKRRVTEYEGQLDGRYSKHFEPIMESVRLHSLSWESTLEWISFHNAEAADQLDEFYGQCLKFN